MTIRHTVLAAALVLTACASTYDPLDDYEEIEPAGQFDVPTPAAQPTAERQALAERGEYLVELLGCAACHTDGALLGAPDAQRPLAGSGVGIAFSNPLEYPNPGVVFPSNLTPDAGTGLGGWSVAEIAQAIRSGRTRHGGILMPVMPWAGFSRLSEEDADAIAVYLQSLPAVRHRVPENVVPGKRTGEPYVYFGIYRSKLPR